MVHKVRFVASTLLDAVRKVETAPASAARAHAYLCQLHFLIKSSHSLTNISGDFLSILSEIERNYLYVLHTIYKANLFTPMPRLDDDRDGTSSGDGMAFVA